MPAPCFPAFVRLCRPGILKAEERPGNRWNGIPSVQITSVQTRRSLLRNMGAAAALTGLGLRNAQAARGHHAHGKAAAAEAEAADATPAATLVGPLPTPARWAYVLDHTTGTVLLDKAGNEHMPPSSLTKMMTAYVVFTFLAAGKLHLGQMLPVSDRAWRTQGSKSFVPQGGNASVSDLIQGMIIQSGNDACIVLAEGIAGSEERFVALMNEAARRIGLTGSHFMNCTGLPAPDHYMTARDVAVLAGRLVHDFPQYYHFFGEKEFTFNGIKQGNRNVLVDKGLADGLKTGHTDAGGFGLCASSERPNADGDRNRVIVVINGTSSSNQRAREGERLLSWAFANFETVTFFHKGQVVEPAAPVWMGTHRTIPLLASEPVSMTVPAGWRDKTRVTVDYYSPLIAPIQAGQPCGTVSIWFNGKLTRQVPLVAGVSVERLGLLGRTLARLGHAPA
ncbi:D-alanyl-D-alanine carboxypeptidase [Oecophyllibacter saccharovorans]|nr:D-alanyl-D-alanine carboxypeptidase [Oecophyllibacter saccharovorans]